MSISWHHHDPGPGLLDRLIKSRRIRRRLAAMVAFHLDLGYQVSPQMYRHLRKVARDYELWKS